MSILFHSIKILLSFFKNRLIEEVKKLFSLFGSKQPSATNVIPPAPSQPPPPAPSEEDFPEEDALPLPVQEEPKKGFLLFGKKSAPALLL